MASEKILGKKSRKLFSNEVTSFFPATPFKNSSQFNGEEGVISLLPYRDVTFFHQHAATNYKL